MRRYRSLFLTVLLAHLTAACVSVIDTVEVNISIPKPCGDSIKIDGSLICKAK